MAIPAMLGASLVKLVGAREALDPATSLPVLTFASRVWACTRP